jgi:hypothetical protein
MGETSFADRRVSEGSSALRRATALLEESKLHEAIALLEPLHDSTGTAAALLGAAYFRLEDYPRAARELRKALQNWPGEPNLGRLYERALANELTDIKRPVPEPVYFNERAPIGTQPGVHAPPSAQLPATRTVRSRLRTAMGEVSGTQLGRAIGLLTNLLGREPRSPSKWSNWYTRDIVRATLMLAHRRDRLNHKQLFAAYGKQESTGFFSASDAAPPWVHAARTSDGSWNDLQEPMAGAALTRFGFNTDPAQTPTEAGARLLSPNPRTVSRVLLTRKDGFKPIPSLNLLAASWIQFMTHDWVSYGDPADAEPYRIPLLEDDPVRQTLHQTHMFVRPTQRDPTRRPGEIIPTHLNEVTSWWDASQIYGSDAKTVDILRSHERGKLWLDPHTEQLPVAPDGVEHTGFRRNWWLGLSMLHTLFVLEHNAICDMLAARYPRFGDQRLFDIARLINAAVMAKIHTIEWTPAILPNRVLSLAMCANWYGVLNALRSKQDRRTLTDIKVADPIVGGIVGNATDDHGVPYSLTREFLSVYRLHSLLPDEIALYEIGGSDRPLRTWSLMELRQAAAHVVTRAVGMPNLFYSFGRQHAGQLVLNNFPETLQQLSIPGAGFYDLGAVDILRDRERGVPRYNRFRSLLGLKPLEHFEQLTDDPKAIEALRQVYAHIEDVDLLIGNLAEAHRPRGFGFGETLFEVFILNASRRLQADRFFTRCYHEEFYTHEGLDWIDGASFKSVLLRHYPKLGATGLIQLENAFEPWDVGWLDPKRHPLRQFDSQLREVDERVRERNAEVTDG